MVWTINFAKHHIVYVILYLLRRILINFFLVYIGLLYVSSTFMENRPTDFVFQLVCACISEERSIYQKIQNIRLQVGGQTILPIRINSYSDPALGRGQCLCFLVKCYGKHMEFIQELVSEKCGIPPLYNLTKYLSKRFT